MKRPSGFTTTDILGGYTQGITRRDPSPVICDNDCYYVWYSRSTQHLHAYSACIWYATSKDGHHWTEQCQALPRGGQGCFDENAVFTPSIFIWKGKYYMSYTGVPEPCYQGLPGQPSVTKTAIGLAVADSPDGPWHRVSTEPIFTTTDNPNLFDSSRE
jgi:beta-xylosidase